MYHEVITTEKVPFRHRVAGVGARYLAWLVDAALIVLLLFAGLLVGSVFEPLKPGLAMAVAQLWFFVLVWGYFLLFEWVWLGQTPGKRLLGIRVIQMDGTRVTFLQAAVRNLARVVDGMPFLLGYLPVCYGLGFAAAVGNAKNRRLGDWAAGTLVVHVERAGGFVRALRDGGEAVVAVPPGMRQRLGQLSKEQKEVLLDLCMRRDQLRISDRAQLFRATADYLRDRLDLPPEAHESDEKLVLRLAGALFA